MEEGEEESVDLNKKDDDLKKGYESDDSAEDSAEEIIKKALKSKGMCIFIICPYREVNWKLCP